MGADLHRREGLPESRQGGARPMSRRPSLPGAAELFRVTGGPAAVPAAAPAPAPAPASEPPPSRAATPIREVPPQPEDIELVTSVPTPSIRPATRTEPEFDREDEPAVELAAPPRRQSGARRRFRTVGERRPSGRERHDEKITVYCSAEELVELEQARL